VVVTTKGFLLSSSFLAQPLKRRAMNKRVAIFLKIFLRFFDFYLLGTSKDPNRISEGRKKDADVKNFF
jgi:hypothetical protein